MTTKEELDKIMVKDKITKSEASFLIECILDTLIEVGNGTSDEDLHYAADLLFKVRDGWVDYVKEDIL